MNFQTAPLNLIEELQLRRWARLNYLPQPDRSPECHPVILEELSRMDDEGMAASCERGTQSPGRHLRRDDAHVVSGIQEIIREETCRSEYHFG